MMTRWIFLALFAAASAGLAQWSQFRGPDTTGHAISKPFPDSFEADDLEWSVELPGKGSSSPIAWEDHIYLTCSTDGSRSLVCLHADTGKQIWEKKFEIELYRMHKFNDLASSSACADATGVYITWTDEDSREVLAFDHDGKKLWQKDLGKYYVNHGSGGSPIVIDGIVVVINDVELEDAGTRFTVGLDAKTGEEKWREEFDMGGKAGFHTPSIFEPKDGKKQIIISCNPHGIVGIDPSTGDRLWETGNKFTTRTVACPLVVDDHIFVTAGSGGGGKESAVVTLKRENDKWQASAKTNLRKALPYVPSPIAKDGLVYMVGDRGILTTLEFPSGKQVYQERLDGNYYASPVCVGDRIYCVSREGELVTVQAGKEFKILGRSQLGERSDATPAIYRDRMYIRTHTRLLCLAAK